MRGRLRWLAGIAGISLLLGVFGLACTSGDQEEAAPASTGETERPKLTLEVRAIDEDTLAFRAVTFG